MHASLDALKKRVDEFVGRECVPRFAVTLMPTLMTRGAGEKMHDFFAKLGDRFQSLSSLVEHLSALTTVDSFVHNLVFPRSSVLCFLGCCTPSDPSGHPLAALLWRA